MKCPKGIAVLPLFGLCLALIFTNSAHGQIVPGFTRGDCNGDTVVDISDPISLLGILFAGDPISCEDSCDVNDDSSIDLADVIFALDALFQFVPIPAPFPDCGDDPTADSLGCQTPPCQQATLVELHAFTLATGRVGMPYQAQLSEDYQTEVSWALAGGNPNVIQPGIPFLEFGLLPGEQLPPGLTLDPTTGSVTGTPTADGWYTFSVWGRFNPSEAAQINVQLAVFTADEIEVIPGQDLTVPGPHSVSTSNSSFLFLHENPWPPPYPLWNCSPSAPPGGANVNKQYRVFLPSGSGPAPVLIFHHGTGFAYSQYNQILSHLASYGVLCISVNDPYSYSFNDYLMWYCWGGHDEGARVMLAMRDLVQSLNDDPTSVLFGRADLSQLFYSGHSRGGASALIAAEFDRNTRGVISLQPTDAKGDSWIGRTNRWNQLPQVPVLSISAEQDFDVIFPFAERLLERFTGASTQMTIYGGCHGFSTDSSSNGCNPCAWVQVAPFVDHCSYVSRGLQIEWTQQFATAFLLRHAFGDLSVEGILYGDEYQTSAQVGVAHQRQLASSLLVDDFEAFPENALGNLTLSNGNNPQLGACYDVPAQPPAPLVPITNLVVNVPDAPLSTFHVSPLGTAPAPLDVSAYRSLEFRIKNADRWGLVDNFGYSWLDHSVTLQDASGNSATVDLDTYLPSTTFHPMPAVPTAQIRMKYQRFITVRVPLTDFLASNSSLNLDSLTELSWMWSAGPGTNTTPYIAIDDVTFE